jgi:diguanylate cyclase (GGDEF)-like protein/PAS domain S-box-containing protein
MSMSHESAICRAIVILQLNTAKNPPWRYGMKPIAGTQPIVITRYYAFPDCVAQSLLDRNKTGSATPAGPPRRIELKKSNSQITPVTHETIEVGSSNLKMRSARNIDALCRRYERDLPARITRLETLWNSIQHNGYQQTELNKLIRLLKDLRGSMTTFGYPIKGAALLLMEEMLQGCMRSHRPPAAREQDLFDKLLDRVRSSEEYAPGRSGLNPTITEHSIPAIPHAESAGRHEDLIPHLARDYESLLSSMSGMAYRCHYNERLESIYLSSRCPELTGYTAGELTGNQGRYYGDLIIPKDSDRVHAILAAAVESKQPYELLYRIHCRNGTLKWIWEQGKAKYRSDGTVAYLEGFYSDFTEHQRLRKALRQYKRMAEASKDILILLDTNYICKVANPAFAKQFGRSQIELPGLAAVEIIGPKAFAERKPLLDRCLQGESVHMPYWLKQGGRDPRYLDVVYEPTFDQDGVVNGLIVSGRDLTELKHAEELALRNNRQVRMLLDCSAEAIYGIDMQGCCTFANRACLEMLGYDAEADFLGVNIHDLIHHHDRDGNAIQNEQCRIYSAFRQASGTHCSDEMFWHKDGHCIPVEYWAYPILDQDQVVGAVVNFLDISERLERNHKLEASEARFRALADLSPVGIYRNDRNGDAIYVNDSTSRMVGLPTEDCLGIGWTTNLHPDDRDATAVLWTDAVNERSTFFAEYRFLHADGTLVWCIGEAVPEYDSAGGFSGHIGTLTDITANKQAQDRIAHFGRLLDDSINEIYVFDATTLQFIYVNRGARENLGYSEQELAGFTPIDIKPEFSQSQFEDILAPLRCGEKQRITFETTHRRKDGSEYPVEVYLQLSDYAGIPAFHAVVQDITERLHAERRLQLYAAIFDTTSEAMLITDAKRRIINVNQAFERVTGYTEQEVLGESPTLLSSGRHAAEFYEAMWGQILEQGNWTGEIWNRRKNGEVYPEWLNINAIYNDAGEAINFIGVFADISTIKESEERLNFLAHHDPLTGLSNRLMFQIRLEQTMAQARRNNSKVALLYLDLDRFKQVNDSLGHDIGDLLLVEAAKRIVTELRAEDTVARLGGDEFTVTLDNISNEQQIPMVAKKIIRILSTRFDISGHELYISASIGIAVYPRDGINTEELTRNADAAMYHAKRSGRNIYQFYDHALNTKLKKRMELESDLHRALEQDQLTLYYQPQFSTIDNRLIGAEALLRWQHPERGIIMPGEFIQLAEECGLIYAINGWVLQHACNQQAQWIERGHGLERMAVNISGGHIERIGLVESVRQVLQSSGITADSLEIEIVEDFIMQDETKALSELYALAELGVSLAIDDFGTGHTSLSYLKKLPVNRLKLDRSFIKDVLDDRDDQAIARSIISLGRHMSMEVVAEGVELPAQRQLLSSYGCQIIQGYASGAPVCAEEFCRLYLQK